MPQRTEIYFITRGNMIKKKKIYKNHHQLQQAQRHGVLAAWTGRCWPPWAGTPRERWSLGSWAGAEGPGLASGQRDQGTRGVAGHKAPKTRPATCPGEALMCHRTREGRAARAQLQLHTAAPAQPPRQSRQGPQPWAQRPSPALRDRERTLGS